VSGLKYTFDAALPSGARVVSVEIPRGTPLVDDQLYKARRNIAVQTLHTLQTLQTLHTLHILHILQTHTLLS
jgi:hypothetical protein